MFVLVMSRSSSKLGHMESKLRSVGQIKEKCCLHSRGHIYDPIIMNFGQNVCLDDVYVEFDTGSRGVKNEVSRSNQRKTLFSL